MYILLHLINFGTHLNRDFIISGAHQDAQEFMRCTHTHTHIFGTHQDAQGFMRCTHNLLVVLCCLSSGVFVCSKGKAQKHS